MNLDRQVGIGDVARPRQPGLLEEARRLRRECDHRAAPAGDLLAAAGFQQVDALADDGLLLVQCLVRKQIVLRVGMRGDVEVDVLARYVARLTC